MAGRTAIGLDIGTSGVRAAELAFGKGQVTLQRFGQVALPEGAVRDGEVINPDLVAEALKQLWAHTKFSGKKVVIGVANQKVVVRQVDLPWMPLDELKKSLGFQVQDFVPMPVEQAVLDFHPLEEVANAAGGRMIRGLLVAASRDMVMNSVLAVQKAGLVPTMVDLSSFAVLRSLARPDHLGLDGQVEALVDVGARVTNIVVHSGGVPRFIRILLLGGQDLTDAVAERMGVPREQAEAVKQELGVSGSGGHPRPAGRGPGPRGLRGDLRRRGARLARLLHGLQRVRPADAARAHGRRQPAQRPGRAPRRRDPAAGRAGQPHRSAAGRRHRPQPRADPVR